MTSCENRKLNKEAPENIPVQPEKEQNVDLWSSKNILQIMLMVLFAPGFTLNNTTTVSNSDVSSNQSDETELEDTVMKLVNELVLT